ncbi:MAG: M28 family peptidase [Bacteroidales bacterium]
MTKQLLTLICTGLFIWTSAGLNGQEPGRGPLMEQFHAISSHDLLDWAATLSSPEFNGRMTGSPGFLKASAWVAENLEKWGIQPAGDEGTYFQWFEHGYNEVHDPGGLSLHIPVKGGDTIIKRYSFPDGYFPGMNSGSGEVTAEVVFVGYGVTAPELDYDDYAGVDVKGKIVMFCRDVPYKDTRNPEYSKWVKYCYHHYKLDNAVKHGAAGMIYIDGLHANPNISYHPGFVWCGIGDEVLNDLFAGQKHSYREVMDNIDKGFKPQSFPTGKMMTISASTTWHEGKACNVLGMIPGTDPDLKDEWVVVGAHLDAVGNCGVLLPGALDNASGCVDIMGAARAMAAAGIPLKRSVLFAFFGGEETGLVGSGLLAQKLKQEGKKVAAYINLDMVGNGTGFHLAGGSTYPEVYKHFEAANEKYLHRSLGSSEVRPHYGRPRSDAAHFEKAGIPTMSLYTTRSVKPVHYHLPGDDVHSLTPEIMEDAAKLLFLSLTGIANEE